MRTASSLNHRRNSAAYVTSARLSARGLPISRVISSARSSARSRISSKPRRRISPRSRGGISAKESWCATAASSARTPSAGEASATSASTSPVDGSWTGRVREPSADTPPPPIHSPVGTASRTRRSSAADIVMRVPPSTTRADGAEEAAASAPRSSPRVVAQRQVGHGAYDDRLAAVATASRRVVVRPHRCRGPRCARVPAGGSPAARPWLPVSTTPSVHPTSAR